MGFWDSHSKCLKAKVVYSYHKVSLLLGDTLVWRQFTSKSCKSCSIPFQVLPSMLKADKTTTPFWVKELASIGHYFGPYYQPKGKPPYRKGDKPSTGIINLAMGLPYQLSSKCKRMAWISHFCTSLFFPTLEKKLQIIPTGKEENCYKNAGLVVAGVGEGGGP